MTTKIAPPCLATLPCENIRIVGNEDATVWFCTLNDKVCILESQPTCGILEEEKENEAAFENLIELEIIEAALDEGNFPNDGYIDWDEDWEEHDWSEHEDWE